MLLPNILDEILCQAIADLRKPEIDLTGPRRIEGIGVQIKRTRLEGRLENIRDVGKEYVIKKVSKESANDTTFTVIAFPTLAAVLR